MGPAFEYIMKNKGIDTDASYPYQETVSHDSLYYVSYSSSHCLRRKALCIENSERCCNITLAYPSVCLLVIHTSR